MPTCVEVRAGSDGMPRLRSREGDLAVRVLRSAPGRVRVALVARRSLLHAGDGVRVDVVVGAGVALELVEVAGTVAYDVRGGEGATWDVDVRVADGAALVWEGLPVVVAAGADLRRTTTVALDGSGSARLRETLVLGRDGEVGGRVVSRLRADADGRPLLAEDLDLAPGRREEFGVLGTARVVDTVQHLGTRAEPAPPGVETYELDAPGTVWRWTGARLHESPLEPAPGAGRFG